MDRDSGNVTLPANLSLGGVPGTLTTLCSLSIDGPEAKIKLASAGAAGFHLSDNSTTPGTQAFLLYVAGGNITITPTGDDGTGAANETKLDHDGNWKFPQNLTYQGNVTFPVTPADGNYTIKMSVVSGVPTMTWIVPVPDRTYTVGIGVITNGTITTEAGVITAPGTSFITCSSFMLHL